MGDEFRAGRPAVRVPQAVPTTTTQPESSTATETEPKVRAKPQDRKPQDRKPQVGATPEERTKPETPAEPEAPRASRSGTDRASGATDTSDPGDLSGNGSGSSTGARRRRRRGGRGRGAPRPLGSEGTTAVDASATSQTAERPRSETPADTADEVSSRSAPDERSAGSPGGATEGDVRPGNRGRRRRGGRGRGGSKPSAGTETETVDGSPETQREDALPDTGTAGEDTGAATSTARGRGRRGGRGRSGGSTGTRGSAEPATRERSLEERVATGGPTRGIRAPRGRGRGRRREITATPPRMTDKLMVITEHGERDQIAVLEEDTLVQHYVTRVGATSMVGNVYLGRVQNVLPGMEAAFVDVGRGRNGVLYAGEVNYAPEDIEGDAPRIEQLLKAGQAVMVQVTKDPMGGKGARLTANLSLAGRYLVLAPNQNLQGISRRLPDEARQRLKTLLKRVKPPEHGVIVRTAAEGATEEALETDLRRLLSIWDEIQKKAKKGKAPTVLYEEPELTLRVVRDLFTDEEFKGLVTDSPRVRDQIAEYLGEVAPDLAAKLRFSDGPLPAFEEHRIVEQIHKALDRKVWLPSGGYLVIERTEAMTIIDVNTGKSVGKTNLEETVVNTNLEASREVARQLRLRDIGGIIVVDFIDMLLEKNKKLVEDTMRDALALDKTRSQVFEIGPLGLMQVTRKRVSSGLVESFSETCPHCEGRGILLTYDMQ